MEHPSLMIACVQVALQWKVDAMVDAPPMSSGCRGTGIPHTPPTKIVISLLVSDAEKFADLQLLQLG
eukprot:5098705-Prorocentrum_lima.AAC.1